MLPATMAAVAAPSAADDERFMRLALEQAMLLPGLVGMEARVGAQHLRRRLKALGNDARLRRDRLTGNKQKIGLKHNDHIDLFARSARGPHTF